MYILSSGKLILLLTLFYLSYSFFLYKTHRTRLLYSSFLTVFCSLFCFGVYSLASIIMGIRQFDNSAEPYHDLQKELKGVESDLKKMGFSFTEFGIDVNDVNDEN